MSIGKVRSYAALIANVHCASTSMTWLAYVRRLLCTWLQTNWTLVLMQFMYCSKALENDHHLHYITYKQGAVFSIISLLKFVKRQREMSSINGETLRSNL